MIDLLEWLVPDGYGDGGGPHQRVPPATAGPVTQGLPSGARLHARPAIGGPAPSRTVMSHPLACQYLELAHSQCRRFAQGLEHKDSTLLGS